MAVYEVNVFITEKNRLGGLRGKPSLVSEMRDQKLPLDCLIKFHFVQQWLKEEIAFGMAVKCGRGLDICFFCIR